MAGTNSNTVNSSKETPGVRYILDNTKYPDYVRNHPVFHKVNKITKVFPGIGLPNMSEECTYFNLNEVREAATQLLYYSVGDELQRAANLVAGKITESTRPLYNLLVAVRSHIINFYAYMLIQEEGKLSIKYYGDITQVDGKAFARKGESFFKSYNKLIEKCKEHNVVLKPIEEMPAFKTFSSINVPGKNLRIVFSSDGEQGAWDIATISMRGISSCQTWGSTQSRGLIGSISSKFVGVIYITNTESKTDHGSKMIRRAMVRFCVHKTTKKPAILMDKIYPSDDAQARKLMIDFLKSKSKLPVLQPGDVDWGQYVLISDTQFKDIVFQANEFTYMDTKIPWRQNSTVNYDAFLARLNSLDHELLTRVHNTIFKKLDEYCFDKKSHREDFRGGVANLLVSMRKHIGRDLFSVYFVPRLYETAVAANSKLPKPQSFVDGKQYERAIIKATIVNMKDVIAASRLKCNNQGKYMKFYPASSEKLIKLVLTEYKKELINSYKKLIAN
jgi:hypothetical protein